MTDTILSQIQNTIDSRKGGDPEASYVAQLLHKGEDKILKKVIEEAGEVLMASKDGGGEHLVYEVADLWFHPWFSWRTTGCAPKMSSTSLRAVKVYQAWRKKPLAKSLEFILQSDLIRFSVVCLTKRASFVLAKRAALVFRRPRSHYGQLYFL